MVFTVPNIITSLRIILTPMYLYFILIPKPICRLASLLIFTVAILTDIVDGYYARKYGEVSRIGKFLDPLADKILIISAYISFTFVNDLIPVWMVILIFIRDLMVTGLRVVFERRGFTLVTRKTAKYKTAFQGFNIFFILIYLVVLEYLNKGFVSSILNFIANYNIIYYITLIVTIVTVLTGIEYFYVNWRRLIARGNEIS